MIKIIKNGGQIYKITNFLLLGYSGKNNGQNQKHMHHSPSIGYSKSDRGPILSLLSKCRTIFVQNEVKCGQNH